ncbi:MAG: FHA domain-containing protein [Anaerolineales bacterium]
MPPSPLVLVIGQQRHPIAGVVRLGRDPACQVVLDDLRASRLHATVWLQGGAAFVRDENSANGTFINGRRVPAGTAAPLHPGDQLRLGASEFHLTADSTDTVIDTRGWAAPPTGEPTGTFPLAGSQAATIRTPLSDFPLPLAAPAPASPPSPTPSAAPRRAPPLAIGCGLAILLLLCAGLGLGATAGRTTLAALLAQLNPGPATAAATAIIGSTSTPATHSTAAPTSGPGEPTPGGSELPVTTVPLGPAPTLLAPQAALDGAAGLAPAVGALNQAELNFLTQDAAHGPAEALDAALLDVAARAMAVAQLTDSLSESLGAQDSGSDQALTTGQTYAALSRLAYSLVIEVQNLRDGLRLGTLASGEAAGIIGEYGARLWQPGFEGAAAQPAANESEPLVEPFQPYTAGASLAPVRRLRPEAYAAMTAGLTPGTVVKSWLATSSQTITRTVWVPALAPGQLAPPDYFDAALAAQLITPAGQAQGELARQAAAAHLRLLLGLATALTPTVGPAPGAPLALFDRGAGPPQPLVVTLLSRAVASQPGAPAGSAAGPGLAAVRLRQTAPTGLSTVPGGHVQALAQGPKVLTLTSAVTQQNQPSVFEPFP